MFKHAFVPFLAIVIAACSVAAASDSDERLRAKYGRYPRAEQSQNGPSCIKCCQAKCCGHTSGLVRIH
jgi:hypothetical protein